MKNDDEKITCIECKVEVIQYYSYSYKGNRGRCPVCKIDFPLE